MLRHLAYEIMRFLLASLLALAAVPADACSMVVYSKVEYEPMTRAFAGVVVGIAEDTTLFAGTAGASLRREFPGGHEELLWTREEFPTLYERAMLGVEPAGALLIRPDPFNTVGPVSELFVVYVAGLSDMCERIYSSAKGLRQHYSIGDRVVVIGEADGGWQNRMQSGIDGATVLVECCYGGLYKGSQFDLASVGPPLPQRYDRTVESDWPRRYIDTYERRGEAATGTEERSFLSQEFEAFKLRLQFEYERDLRHLAYATSTRQRTALLLKIRSYTALRRDGYRGVLSECAYARLADRYLPESSNRWYLNALLLAYNLDTLPTVSECSDYNERMDEREADLRDLREALGGNDTEGD